MTIFKQDNTYFIGCPQPNEDSLHTKYNIDIGNIDITYLEHMVLYGLPELENQRERCSFWDISTSKRKHCRMLKCLVYAKYTNFFLVFHHSRATRMQAISCEVKYDIYLPVNVKRFPFYMLSIRRAHHHIPPPPKTIPKDILNALNSTLIARDDLLHLTARIYYILIILSYTKYILGSIYLNPVLQELLQKYKKDSLRKIHPALNCEDKVSALLLRAKLFKYPEGAQLAGK